MRFTACVFDFACTVVEQRRCKPALHLSSTELPNVVKTMREGKKSLNNRSHAPIPTPTSLALLRAHPPSHVHTASPPAPFAKLLVLHLR
ncbi:MAG: hypothetical protein ACPIOQ_65390, partial [Promethearchaeia archaeon]